MRLVFLAALGLSLGFAPCAESVDLPGDTAANPLPVLSLPFFASGNTCDYTHQYDEFCPFDGQLSPDVVYAYEPTTPVVVNLSLCESGYDTKILVYENQATSSHLYACIDDWCSGPDYDWPYLAYLRELPLVPGNTYYFVVDGYGSSCGPYVLRIVESATCNLVCPPGSLEESELKCIEGAADSTNGGCGSDPPRFEPVPPSPDAVTFCSFTNSNLGHRDQDWYELVPSLPAAISVSVEADIAAFVSVFDGSSGCASPPVLGTVVTEPCEIGSVAVSLPAGPVWIRVQPLLAWDVPCPAEYVLTIGGQAGAVNVGPVPQSPTVGRLTVVPNPSLGATTIRGSAPGRGTVTVRIHDVRGRLVRRLHEGPLPPGPRDIAWDGRDDRGGIAPPGVYFCRWEDADRVRTARIVRTGS